MRPTERVWTALAALSGLIGVAAGAFAAHGLRDARAAELIRTGSSYELIHALAALAGVALGERGLPRASIAPPIFLAATVLFSGSLYALAMAAPRWIGVLTPLGGLLFLAGWAALGWAAVAGSSRHPDNA
jgi:uncharacterized membrane protein YgdD (TMEM256/DUF423 family)